MTSQQAKPVIASYRQLCYALRVLHMWNEADLKRLHDIYVLGAPTPNSRMLLKTMDVRKVQPGNVEYRLILPKKLEAWVEDICKRRGITYQPGEALRIIETVSAVFDGDVSHFMKKE